MNKLYRYEDRHYYYGGARVDLLEFEVIKETSSGVWIKSPYYSKNKWVNLKARKKFACPTVEEALESYLMRKKRQIRILKGQLSRAKSALYEGENLANKYFCRHCEKPFQTKEEADTCCKLVTSLMRE